MEYIVILFYFLLQNVLLKIVIFICSMILFKKFSVMEKKADYSTNSICLFFTETVKLHEEDSLIQIYDLNLLHEKYLNWQLVNTAYDFINGRYLPSKLYFSENLNQIDSNTIIGNTIEVNDGIFFIYNYEIQIPYIGLIIIQDFI